VDDGDHATLRARPLRPRDRVGVQRRVVILIAFVLLAFVGVPVFLSWKRNRT
jgi:hypothetical protein